MKRNKKIYKTAATLVALALAAALALGGCATVGPDYTRPETTLPEKYMGASADQAPADEQALAEWWTLLGDPVLTDLMQRAVAGNLSLKEAAARVREVRARRKAAETGLFPEFSASGAASASQSKSNGRWNTTESYSAGLDVSWEVDLFGTTRREIEATQADYEAAGEDLRDALVSLTAETATTYVMLRTYQLQLASAEKNLDQQQSAAELTRIKYKTGLSGALDLEQATYSLESTRSQIPALEASIEEMKNRLAVLLGGWPGDLSQELEASAPIPESSLESAVGIPADLLRRRPDIRSAERSLAAQTARIGVAEADLYPKLNLSGSLGWKALALSGLFTPASVVAAAAGGISYSIFDAGSVRANIEVQNAQQEQALLEYEALLRTAVEEVENALTALVKETKRQESLSKAAAAAREAADLALQEYQGGLTDFQKVLETQQSLTTFEDKLAQSRGQAALDLIVMYKALGGGWSAQGVEAYQ